METLLSASTAQSHCNMTCSGSPEDTGLDKRCGARDAVNVYGLTGKDAVSVYGLTGKDTVSVCGLTCKDTVSVYGRTGKDTVSV